MRHDLYRSEQSQRDLLEIWRFVAEDNPAAADKLLRRIGAAFMKTADFPGIGRSLPDVGSDLRALVYKRYILIYTVDDAQKTVTLMRVIHGARRWQDMLS